MPNSELQNTSSQRSSCIGETQLSFRFLSISHSNIRADQTDCYPINENKITMLPFKDAPKEHHSDAFKVRLGTLWGYYNANTVVWDNRPRIENVVDYKLYFDATRDYAMIDITEVIREYVAYHLNGIAILPDDDYVVSFSSTSSCYPPYVCIRVKENDCCEEQICCKVGSTGPRGLRGPRGIQGITGPDRLDYKEFKG